MPRGRNRIDRNSTSPNTSARRWPISRSSSGTSTIINAPITAPGRLPMPPTTTAVSTSADSRIRKLSGPMN
ncbi:MAG: hypothetical protein M5U30_21585 [Burkholderiaceae bacterium]|nr:hypothetical protein [Burkholderiaceae bacterium]